MVGRTLKETRDVCFEGESGLLAVIPRGCVADWKRSFAEVSLVLTNGARLTGYSSQNPDALRGPQHHRAWCDELGSWEYPTETWDNLMFGLRLGGHPQTVVTTTPKPITLLRELVKRAGDDVHLTRGSTYENLANLAPAFAQAILAKYEGTTTGRQELYAELLDEAEGALWVRSTIDANRVVRPPELVRVVVAVDPSVTAGESSAECGIVVAGVDERGHGYVLDDVSMRAHPADWMRTAVEAYRVRQADRLVAETNNGGEMVEYLLRTIDSSVSYRAVTASRGKRTRAEPIAALYEQGRIHHVGAFLELEDQMVTWEPGDTSPDRLDALVWALTELMVTRRTTDGPLMV